MIKHILHYQKKYISPGTNFLSTHPYGTNLVKMQMKLDSCEDFLFFIFIFKFI